MDYEAYCQRLKEILSGTAPATGNLCLPYCGCVSNTTPAAPFPKPTRKQLEKECASWESRFHDTIKQLAYTTEQRNKLRDEIECIEGLVTEIKIKYYCNYKIRYFDFINQLQEILEENNYENLDD